MSNTCEQQGRTAPPSIRGQTVPRPLLGELRAVSVDDDLRSRLADDGYLLIRGALRAELVTAARQLVLQQLAAVDEILEPYQDGIASGRSRRAAQHPDLGAFWQRVSEAPPLRRCVHAAALYDLLHDLFGEPVKPFDFVWLRAFSTGRASPLHIDHPYMNRGTRRIVSCWTPLGRVALNGGALFIVEHSHRIDELRETFEDHDVDRKPQQPGYIDEHPIAFAKRHNRRLLSSEFSPGDVLIFDHFLAHASFDNSDSMGRVRLSCDTRWQPAVEPMDPRFQGPSPSAHGGLGYACLSAAQPLTAELAHR